MDFKIEFKCGKCKCKFELRPVDFADRDKLACPNCMQPFPQKEFELIKAGLNSLSQVPEMIPEDAGLFGENFYLNVKSYSIFDK